LCLDTPKGWKECSQGLSAAKPLVRSSKNSHAEGVQGLCAPFQGAGFVRCFVPRSTPKRRTPGLNPFHRFAVKITARFERPSFETETIRGFRSGGLKQI
jgi:hypothetical protein